MGDIVPVAARQSVPRVHQRALATSLAPRSAQTIPNELQQSSDGWADERLAAHAPLSIAQGGNWVR